jgi:hypothetical protein
LIHVLHKLFFWTHHPAGHGSGYYIEEEVVQADNNEEEEPRGGRENESPVSRITLDWTAANQNDDRELCIIHKAGLVALLPRLFGNEIESFSHYFLAIALQYTQDDYHTAIMRQFGINDPSFPIRKLSKISRLEGEDPSLGTILMNQSKSLLHHFYQDTPCFQAGMLAKLATEAKERAVHRLTTTCFGSNIFLQQTQPTRNVFIMETPRNETEPPCISSDLHAE